MIRAGFAVLGLTIVFADAVEVTYPDELQAADGWHDLRLGAVDFLDWGFQTRGWNDGIPGPTFRMKPGESLKINFANDLSENGNVKCDLTGTEFCESETTNLHTHGLHVSGKSKFDGLPHDSDDIFVEVRPGTNTTFEFQIPEHHAPGTHWYHPHHHHATALQAAGGAAGMMIVEDPTGYLPEEYNMPEHILMISFHDLEALQGYAQNSQAIIMATAAQQAAAGGNPTSVYLVNGMLKPEVTIVSGKWHRLRMLFAAIELVWEMEVIHGPATCDLRLLAKDGIYLDKIPRTIPYVPLHPGARADVAIRCTCPSFPCKVPSAAETLESNVFTFNVVQGDVVDPELPEFYPIKPCYLADLRSAAVPSSNIGVVGMDPDTGVTWNGAGQSMTWAAVHANGMTMRDWSPIHTLTSGNVYEFQIEGTTDHPLHIHINPYQITWLPMVDDDGYFQVGDWHDTVQLPEMQDVIKIRTQTDIFTGKQVVHCHLLEHEDEGLMGYFQVDGAEGATYTCAESLDVKCYRGAFADRPGTDHIPDNACFGAGSTPPDGPLWPYIFGIGASLAVVLLCVVGYCLFFRNRDPQEPNDVEAVDLARQQG